MLPAWALSITTPSPHVPFLNTLYKIASKLHSQAIGVGLSSPSPLLLVSWRSPSWCLNRATLLEMATCVVTKIIWSRRIVADDCWRDEGKRRWYWRHIPDKQMLVMVLLLYVIIWTMVLMFFSPNFCFTLDVHTNWYIPPPPCAPSSFFLTT